MPLVSINPFNTKKIKSYKPFTLEKIDESLECSDQAFTEWKKVAISSRVNHLKRAGEILEQRKREFAELITLEMGKPVLQAEAEIEKCAWVCNYYADNAKYFLVDEPINTEASNSFISYEPLGSILAIMPWNFPFWQVFRFAAPALIAGNVCLLKHASNVCGCATLLESIFLDAGFPKGCFLTLLTEVSDVDNIIADPRVKAVTITGSEMAGSAVAAAAGKYIKKSVLELGGSDPFIVLDDANIKKAAESAVKSRMLNNGQSCIAAKRFIVMENILETFTGLLVKEFEKLRIGDPMNESTDIGPMARTDLRDSLAKQVESSVANGAEILFQSKLNRKTGAFYPPTLLGNVTPGMAAFDEELFGPVASLSSVKDVNEAIRFANSTSFGLGASIWTEDKEKGARLARHILAGSVFVNSLVKSDPRLPFGGIKKSGYGRELSHYAVKEFVNVKSIWVE